MGTSNKTFTILMLIFILVGGLLNIIGKNLRFSDVNQDIGITIESKTENKSENYNHYFLFPSETNSNELRRIKDELEVPDNARNIAFNSSIFLKYFDEEPKVENKNVYYIQYNPETYKGDNIDVTMVDILDKEKILNITENQLQSVLLENGMYGSKVTVVPLVEQTGLGIYDGIKLFYKIVETDKHIQKFIESRYYISKLELDYYSRVNNAFRDENKKYNVTPNKAVIHVNQFKHMEQLLNKETFDLENKKLTEEEVENKLNDIKLRELYSIGEQQEINNGVIKTNSEGTYNFTLYTDKIMNMNIANSMISIKSLGISLSENEEDSNLVLLFKDHYLTTYSDIYRDSESFTDKYSRYLKYVIKENNNILTYNEIGYRKGRNIVNHKITGVNDTRANFEYLFLKYIKSGIQSEPK